MKNSNYYITNIINDSVNGVGPLPLVAVPICVDVVGYDYDYENDSWFYYVIDSNENINDVSFLKKNDYSSKIFKVKDIYKTLTLCNKDCDKINRRIIKAWFKVIEDKNIDEIRSIGKNLVSKQYDEIKTALANCKKIQNDRNNTKRGQELERSLN